LYVNRFVYSSTKNIYNLIIKKLSFEDANELQFCHTIAFIFLSIASCVPS